MGSPFTIDHRDEFPKLIDHYGYKEVLELGVSYGGFSQQLIKSQLRTLYLVDAWNTPHHVPDHIDIVKQKLAGRERRYKLMHMTFEEARPQFWPQSLDFIYIDGFAHTGQQGIDFVGWVQTLKIGGCIAGHDYSERWPKTIEAVDAFRKKMNRKLYLTKEDSPKDKRYASWYIYY